MKAVFAAAYVLHYVSAALHQPRLPPCDEHELSSYALALASGPGLLGRPEPEAPACVPSQTQGLWPLGSPSQAAVPARNLTSMTSLGAARTQKRAWRRQQVGEEAAAAAAAAPYLVNLHVVQSDASWCALPCNGPSWEISASKPEAASPYMLLEAAIWRQERRVALYHFDAAWLKATRRTYHDICGGAWKCPAYRDHRESKLLVEVGPWPRSIDDDEKELSTFLRQAFQKVFQKLHEVAPAAEHVALTYSGHGAQADGSLFQGAVQREDAVALMQEITGGSGFAFLNFGGNCAEGRWNMLATFQPFTKFILASDLDVGGVKMTDEERKADDARARQELSALEVISGDAEARTPVRQILDNVVEARQQTWEATGWKAPIQRQGLEQAIAVYDTAGFKPFRASLREAYLKLSDADARLHFEEHVEAQSCDVLGAVRFFEPGANSSQTAASLLAVANLRGRVRVRSKTGRLHTPTASPLEEKFLQLRVNYASTRSLIDWSGASNGLGFNFLGWKDPPCDLVTPLGGDAPKPAGGWHQERLEKARARAMR